MVPTFASSLASVCRRAECESRTTDKLKLSEIIQDLERMMHTHFKTFEANTKAPPAKILFFRDGVSEGQYAAVSK